MLSYLGVIVSCIGEAPYHFKVSYLRRRQLSETHEVLGEFLGRSLRKFHADINDAFLKRLEWEKAVDAAGVKNVMLGLPMQDIKEKINTARGDNIKLLFLSYAAIAAYKAEFHQALENRCNITILTGSLDTNIII